MNKRAGPEYSVTSKEFLIMPKEQETPLDGLMKDAIGIYWRRRRVDPNTRRRRYAYLDEITPEVVRNSQMAPGALFDAITPDLTVTPDWVMNANGYAPVYPSDITWNEVMVRNVAEVLNYQLRRFPDIQRTEVNRINASVRR